jgi:hypothetical protein
MEIKIEQPVTQITLTLDLSAREAMVLRTICRNIGGQVRGPRSVTEEIEDALMEAGISYYDPIMSGINGCIIFPSDWSDLAPTEDED